MTTTFTCRESKEGVLIAVDDGVRVAPWGEKRPRFTIPAGEIGTFAEAIAGETRRKLKSTSGWVMVQPARQTVALTWPEGQIMLNAEQKQAFLEALSDLA